MKAMTLTVRFMDGTELTFMGPEQDVPDSGVDQLFFSEVGEMPDLKLSDLVISPGCVRH